MSGLTKGARVPKCQGARMATSKPMKIGSIELSPPYALAPMAGMTDTAFRRLVKRKGGCGLVVTEMVSSEGLVRGIDRTLEYAEYTEEERPVSIQIFGGDPEKMAAAARIVEEMGADIVDVNMGCPVHKIAKHSAGCSLMREPSHAADVVRAMTRAVKIPVTVKMRAGWDHDAINAPDMARRMEEAGAAAVAVHGRTAAQSYSGVSDWDLIETVAAGVSIPVFGSGDCIEPGHVVDRMRGANVGGVLVGRGALRNPWIFQQAADVAAGRAAHEVSSVERGQFLLDYIDMLMQERLGEAEGFRHIAPGQTEPADQSVPARGHDRWVINKLRALNSWYTKGLDNGSHLRIAINAAESIPHLRAIVEDFFFAPEVNSCLVLSR
jgi:tRNA-dihydrouridine synthase B